MLKLVFFCLCLLEKNKQLLFCFFPLTIKTFADDLKNVSRRHKRPTAAAGVRPQIDADEREASQKNGFCNGAQVLSGESSPWSDAERVFVLFRGGGETGPQQNRDRAEKNSIKKITQQLRCYREDVREFKT